MQKLGTLLVASIVLSVWCSSAPAARCSGITDTVFCDDFDCWCNGNTVPGEDCTACSSSTDPPDQAAFRDFWLLETGGCEGPWAQHALAGAPYSWKVGADQGYGVRVNMHEYSNPPAQVARHQHDMTPEILNNPDNSSSYGSINGAGAIELAYGAYPSVNPNYVDAMDRTLSPDTLKGQFFMHMADCGHYGQMMTYVELSLDDDHAPVDFVSVECNNSKVVIDGNERVIDCTCDYLHPGTPGCATGEQARCDAGEVAGMACANDAECYVGPTRQQMQTTDGEVHAAFAIGAVAMLDNTPCLEGTGEWPQAVWRFVVYDGLTWRQFQAPNFGIPMTPGNIDVDAWDLRHDNFWNKVYFSIGTDYIEVRLQNTRSEAMHATTRCVTYCGSKKCVGGALDGQPCTSDTTCNDLSEEPPGTEHPPALPNPYFVARVPRQYKGSFNRVSIGSSKGHDLSEVPVCTDYGTIESFKRCRGGENDNLPCETDADCPPATTDVCMKTWQRANDMGVEELVLYDGVFEPLGSACCVCDSTGCSCQITDEATCVAQGGTFYNNLKCDQVLCCPNPFADADADGDVDQADFARFQACYTGAGVALGIGCECFDAHPVGAPDNDIDSEDWGAFEACASGAGIAADPACDDAP